VKRVFELLTRAIGVAQSDPSAIVCQEAFISADGILAFPAGNYSKNESVNTACLVIALFGN